MLPSSVTLLYGDRRYTFAENPDKVMKGKLACDCSKSTLIREYCDANFPDLKCGQKIQIESLVELNPVEIEGAPRNQKKK